MHLLRTVMFLRICLQLLEDNVGTASILFKSTCDCSNAPRPMPVQADVDFIMTFRNNSQLARVNLSVPFPLHTNTLASVNVEYNTLGKWVSVLKLDDKKGICNLLTFNAGELWPDVQKAIGMAPKACPIQKGNYHSNHVLINATKLKIATVPPGSYRMTLQVREKANNRVLLCKIYNIQDTA